MFIVAERNTLRSLLQVFLGKNRYTLTDENCELNRVIICFFLNLFFNVLSAHLDVLFFLFVCFFAYFPAG